MAVLHGFPPSNLIQIDPPQLRECELCYEKFYSSFPNSLLLEPNLINYSLLVCERCYYKDQTELKLPGVYSQVKHKFIDKELPKKKPTFQKIYSDFGTVTIIPTIIFELTQFRSAWRKESLIPILPSEFIIKCNTLYYNLLARRVLNNGILNIPHYLINYFKYEHNAYIPPATGWNFELEHVPEMPTHLKAIFVFEKE